MRDRLRDLLARRDELEALLADPAVQADREAFARLSREHAAGEEAAAAATAWLAVDDDLAAARELAGGADAGALAAEADELAARRDELTDRVRRLLLPRDPDDDRDVILEVRAGTGGDEAGLFAGELYAMYLAYAHRRGWSVRELAVAPPALCGVTAGARTLQPRRGA